MSKEQIRRELEEGRGHHRAGRLREADALYRKVLNREPRNADALHYLGVLALQVGQVEPAVRLIRQAVQIEPGLAEVHNSLGEALRRGGKVDEAIGCFNRAIEINPKYSEAQFNLGIALMARDRLAEAEAALRGAANSAGSAEARAAAINMLGVALARQEKMQEALQVFREAVERDPKLADGWANLAAAHERLEQLEESIQAGRRAIAIQPDHQSAHYNLGVALHRADRLQEAAGALETAVRLKPDHVEALSTLGACYARLGRTGEAVAALQRALSIDPNHPESLVNLASVYVEGSGPLQGQAEALCRRALAVRPKSPGAIHMLGRAVQKAGRLEQAIALLAESAELEPRAENFNNLGLALLHAGRVAEAEEAYRAAMRIKPQWHAIGSNLLITLLYDNRHTPQEVYREHAAWGERHAAPLGAAARPYPNGRDPERRLRIGYTSNDLRRHSVNYFMEPVLAHHDRENFEVFCYSDDWSPDRETERLRGYVQHWRGIRGMSDEAVAEQIRSDQIDIMVELGGHTAHNRLLMMARRPAPVQVSYLGYPATTGVPAIQYRLTDELADPVGMTEPLWTEELVRLPGSAWCYAPPAESVAMQRGERAEGAPIVFGCFNVVSKVNAQVVECWSRILREVPGSRLMMKSWASDGPSLEMMRERFAAHGVEPDRLEIRGREDSFIGHLALYEQMDIALDPFPYAGTTTTCEAMWMGVPVVTLAGRTHAGRVGVSLLNSVGLPELVGESVEEYVAIAVKLAREQDELREVQRALRDRMKSSALMDGSGFTRNLEAAYRQMWRTYCGR